MTHQAESASLRAGLHTHDGLRVLGGLGGRLGDHSNQRSDNDFRIAEVGVVEIWLADICDYAEDALTYDGSPLTASVLNPTYARLAYARELGAVTGDNRPHPSAIFCDLRPSELGDFGTLWMTAGIRLG